MTTPSPEHGGYAWTEWLAAEMERNPMPDTWPTSLRDQHLAADEVERATKPEGVQLVAPTPVVTVESVEAHVRAHNGGKLSLCPVCEQAPVLIRETELPSDEPTGHTAMLLGQPIHVRRAVIVVCSNEEDCPGMGLEITGPPTSESLCKCPDGDCAHKPTPPVVIHRQPIGADPTTPCCDTNPLHLPREHYVTQDNARVTCTPTPTVVLHWQPRMLPPKPVAPQAEFWPSDHLPRTDPDESYECALRDLHNDDEHTGIGWVDFVSKDTDREHMQWVDYYQVTYPEGSNIKPMRVCEPCATYLTGLAPYLRPEADTGKLTDRIAFDYPTADGLDALYYYAHAEEPDTHERIALDALDAHGRSVLGSRVLHSVFTPLTTSARVLLQRLPFVSRAAYDELLHDIHVKATGLLYNAGDPHDLVRALAKLNSLLSARPGA